jgi:hypothetical protein
VVVGGARAAGWRGDGQWGRPWKGAASTGRRAGFLQATAGVVPAARARLTRPSRTGSPGRLALVRRRSRSIFVLERASCGGASSIFKNVWHVRTRVSER